jgi:hypothetical protein
MILGAEYPQDCMVTLCDAKRDCLNNLDFDAGTEHFRDELDHYYPLRAFDCVRVQVKGTVMEHSCPGCTTVYSISVADLSVKP